MSQDHIRKIDNEQPVTAIKPTPKVVNESERPKLGNQIESDMEWDQIIKPKIVEVKPQTIEIRPPSPKLEVIQEPNRLLNPKLEVIQEPKGNEWNLSGEESNLIKDKRETHKVVSLSNKEANLSITIPEDSQPSEPRKSTPRLAEIDEQCAAQFVKDAFEDASEKHLH